MSIKVTRLISEGKTRICARRCRESQFVTASLGRRVSPRPNQGRRTFPRRVVHEDINLPKLIRVGKPQFSVAPTSVPGQSYPSLPSSLSFASRPVPPSRSRLPSYSLSLPISPRLLVLVSLETPRPSTVSISLRLGLASALDCVSGKLTYLLRHNIPY